MLKAKLGYFLSRILLPAMSRSCRRLSLKIVESDGDTDLTFNMNHGSLSKLFKIICMNGPQNKTCSCNVPVLPGKESTDRKFFNLTLVTQEYGEEEHSIEMRILKSNLYTVAHWISGKKWMEFELGQTTPFCEDSYRLESSGSYLEDKERVSNIQCYRKDLSWNIKNLCFEDPTKSDTYLKFLMPLIVVVCEGSRFAILGESICRIFTTSPESQKHLFKLPIPSAITNNWKKLSGIMIANDDNTTVDGAFKNIADQIASECSEFSEEDKESYKIESTAHACYRMGMLLR